jgi:transposase
MREFVGIDVSKAKLDICWLRNIETGTIKTKKLENNPKGFEALAQWLVKTLEAKSQDIIVSVEPTNVYHEPLCYSLQSKGFQVLLVNPGKAKKYAESLNLTHKTDKIDAYSLAKYAEAQKSSLALWKPESKETRELKELLRRLTALEKDRQRELNRLENYQLTEASKDVQKSSEEMIEQLEKQIQNLTQKIDDHIDGHPDLKRNRALLESINGIGKVMSRELVCLFLLKQFKDARQVSAYLGLIPKLRTSGTLKGKTVLTKTGPGSIRAKLYMAAISASQHNPDIRAQKDRLLLAGKTSMQALCAAMRKLVQICYGVVKHQSEYQPQVA